ncbi:hypothetical protein Tco_1336278 [Tanacetum coccineum]
MATKLKLDADLSGEPVDQTDYRSKIGSLMCLTSSIPDIVQAMPIMLVALILAKALLGGIQFIGDKLTADFQRSRLTAMSSKAEYVALSASCAQLMWMRTQLKDYGFNYNNYRFIVFSVAHINLIQPPYSTPVPSTSILDINFIKGTRLKNGIIELYFVRTEYQQADMITTALPEERFQYLGKMPTKTELTLEQSQQGVSNDVLVSIEGVEE